LSSKKTSGGGKPQTGKASTKSSATCPSCNAGNAADANFCQKCGKPIGNSQSGGRTDPVTIAIYSIIGVCVVGALAGIIFFANKPGVAPPQVTAPVGSPAQAPAVDLASMSPREAADRLFNRVMIAHEQGNTAEVQQFAPMAIEAYDQVDFLDADAHYHIGLIHAASGDFAQARKEVETLKQYTPNHLLAMLIEHEAALATGDISTAAAIEAAFADAYIEEVKTNRPEYQAHLNSIDGFRARIATQPTAPGTSN
jgi:uncharacterized protein (DUF983 family)